MRMVRAWIEAMRLRTLPVSLAGVICGWIGGEAGRLDGELLRLPGSVLRILQV